MSTTKAWITPVYQIIIGNAITRVVNALNDRNLPDAWEALKTLYDSCPMKIKEKLSKDFLETQKGYDNIMLKRGVDLITTQGIRQHGLSDYLASKVHFLYGKTKDMLEEGGYLESKPRKIEMNVPKEWLEQDH